MLDATCSVSGCPVPLSGPLARVCPLHRFLAKIDLRVDGCWEWTGARLGGYGRFPFAHRKHVAAHRWSYEHFIGPIPDRLQIDHLCRNRACVRPDHLEPVTQTENRRRGVPARFSPAALAAFTALQEARSARTHCPRGHPYDEANTYVYRGRRNCRACNRERSRLRKRATRLASLTLAVIALALAACTPETAPYRHRHVGDDAGTDFTYTTAPGAVIVNGTANSGNEREVWWPSAAPDVVNGTSCATWAADSGHVVQEGVALHITPTSALTVTKNVWLGAHWIFNVHTWGGASPNLIGAFDLEPVFRPGGIERPLPWRVCARATAATFEFKAWPLPDLEPAWGDPTHGGAVELPAGYDHGRSGWYIGHMGPLDAATFTDLTTS